MEAKFMKWNDCNEDGMIFDETIQKWFNSAKCEHLTEEEMRLRFAYFYDSAYAFVLVNDNTKLAVCRRDDSHMPCMILDNIVFNKDIEIHKIVNDMLQICKQEGKEAIIFNTRSMSDVHIEYLDGHLYFKTSEQIETELNRLNGHKLTTSLHENDKVVFHDVWVFAVKDYKNTTIKDKPIAFKLQ